MERQKIFLKKDSGTVRVFYSEEEMHKAGITEADKVVTEDEYNGKGCYTRIINGEIIVGRTEEEIAAEENQEKIDEIQRRFKEIDQLDGPRPIREAVTQLAGSAGLDTSYLNRHEAEAIELREKLAELKSA